MSAVLVPSRLPFIRYSSCTAIAHLCSILMWHGHMLTWRMHQVTLHCRVTWHAKSLTFFRPDPMWHEESFADESICVELPDLEEGFLEDCNRFIRGEFVWGRLGTQTFCSCIGAALVLGALIRRLDCIYVCNNPS